jgi:hypothetical protein
MSRMTRRRFCQSVGSSSFLLPPSFVASEFPAPLQTTSAAPDASHIGNLYPFVQKQADRSPLELSFLHSRFRDPASWQKIARARVLDCLCYSPPSIAPAPEIIQRTDRGDYIEEYLTFQTTPDLRVPG